VCLVDIGGGTSDIAVFREGAIRTRPWYRSGDQITNDIAMALRTPPRKRKTQGFRHGCGVEAALRGRPDDRGRGRGRSPAANAFAPDRSPKSSSLASRNSTPSSAGAARPGYEELLSSGVVLTGGSP